MNPKIPFTIEQFFQVFESYNQAIFPLQIVLILAAFAAAFLASQRFASAGKIISVLLAFLWLWAGVVYHWMFFSQINGGAYLFGAAFVFQAWLFFNEGFKRNRLNFKFEPNLYSLTGIFFIVFALIIYPAIGFLFGHIYPAAPTFGAPCPMTIFTFGMLLLTDKKFSYRLLIVPFLWSVIGLTAAVKLGVIEDFGLIIAGVTGTFLIFYRDISKSNFQQTDYENFHGRMRKNS